ncbi:unnamed protein product [Penicillium nalgiovense]|nr:unnamed protein product [Penicillium nalgiovense]
MRMPINPGWLTPETEIRLMPPHLVTSVARPPCTLLVLPRIVPRTSCSPAILNFFHWLNGNKVANMMSCRRDIFATQLIAWRLILIRKTVGKVTEEDLVISPSDYWGKSLQAKLEDMLQAKKKRHQRVRSEGTAVTVKVDERSQKNLENFYNSTNINWTTSGEAAT